jgi:hypothetical protein
MCLGPITWAASLQDLLKKRPSQSQQGLDLGKAKTAGDGNPSGLTNEGRAWSLLQRMIAFWEHFPS